MYILYCRFATDLALWRPASPELVERANAAKSLFFSSVDIQPAATAEEKIQMCTQSVLRGENKILYYVHFGEFSSYRKIF